MKYILMASIVFFSNTLLAAWEGNDRTISSLKFGEGGLSVRFSPRPAGCQEDVYRMHAHLKPNHAYYKEMVSSLLAAYTASMPVSSIWYADGGKCEQNTYSTLELYQIEFKEK